MQETTRPDRRPLLVAAAVMAIVAATLHVAAPAFVAPPSELVAPAWAVALGFLVADLLRVPLRARGDSPVVSLAQIPLLVGVVALTPSMLVAARLTGAAVGSASRTPRPAPRTVAFDLALAYLETATVIVAYRMLLAGRSPVSLTGLSVGFTALVVGSLVSAPAATLTRAATQRGEGSDVALRSLALTIGASIGVSGVAAAALAALWAEPVVLVPLLLVSAAVLWELRSHGSLSRRFEDLESVYEFTTAVDRAETTDEVVDSALDRCGRLFVPDLVEVVTVRGVGSTATTRGDGGRAVRRPAPPAVVEALSGESSELGSGATPLTRAPEPIREHYAARDVHSGMIAALSGGGGTATMIVVGRRSRAEPGLDELRLLDALARQARVAFERVRLMERLRTEIGQKEHQILHDALTGLPNRLQFSIVVEDALRRATRSTDGVAVLLVDLDHFKEINDTLGHQRGDVLLRETAMRLATVIGAREHLARLGGDEFGVVLHGVPGVAEAVDEARRIGAAIQQPFVTEGLAVQVFASIGIALAPDHGTDGETLLRRAEVAMYEAKETAVGVEVYDPQRDRYSTRRLALAAELAVAIDAGALGVHYQPKTRLTDGRVVGIEALARWHHPSHGNVPPAEFIEVAERTGLIRPLTEHVLRTAFRDAVRLRDEGHPLTIAVNIAANSLGDPGFPDLLAQLIGETDVDPQTVILEVTESTVMTDSPRARMVLEALDELGVELSIDDFGTGYSSLAHLSNLPVDEVKVDRSFVTGMAADPRLASIVTSTTALGHALGLRVVAEGVEHRAVWALLRDAGCDLAQGYYIARPMPFTDLGAWLEVGGVADGERGPRAMTG
jgi:diguanylate cyclase (GGDEF)-like protein